MNLILTLSLIFAACAFGYMFYDYIVTHRKKKKFGNLVRVFLFEHIGNDKVFIGLFRGEEREDADELGVYIIIKGVQKPISNVQNYSFFPDKQGVKCLTVCKYSEDDFRPIERLRSNEWFRRVQLSEEDIYEMEQEVDEDQNPMYDENDKPILLFKTDEDGHRILKKDDDGNDMPTHVLEPYDEPLGVTQSAREAQRFNRAFTKRMQHKRAEKKALWERLAPWAAFSLGVIFLSIAFIQMNKAETERHQFYAEALGEVVEELQEIKQEQKEPPWLEKIVRKVVREENQEESPPK